MRWPAAAGQRAQTPTIGQVGRRQLADALPIFIAAILAASFLLLMVMFRSLAVPLKAAVMNLLSIGGAYGIVVAVFQWGWLNGLLNLEGTFLHVSACEDGRRALRFALSDTASKMFGQACGLASAEGPRPQVPDNTLERRLIVRSALSV
jgi:uncharacterized membrane protein YdfJ with MMPL/SSD domain